MLEMKTLTLDNGEGKHTFTITEGKEYNLRPITLDDVVQDTCRPLSDASMHVGGTNFNRQAPITDRASFCTFDCKINEGDMIIFTHLSDMYSRLDGFPLVVVDDNGIITEVIQPYDVRDNPMYTPTADDYTRVAGAYKFKTSGTLYMCFKYTDVFFAEFFYIKKPHPMEPLVLNTNLATDYTNGVYLQEGVEVYPNNYFGDEALKAIMEGRQILVRINNASGDIHTALYSPIYQYQLPNYRNDYLYLFYLEDSKQTVDLTAMGIGKIEIPVYGQLKLKVSREYHQSPLL